MGTQPVLKSGWYLGTEQRTSGNRQMRFAYSCLQVGGDMPLSPWEGNGELQSRGFPRRRVQAHSIQELLCILSFSAEENEHLMWEYVFNKSFTRQQVNFEMNHVHLDFLQTIQRIHSSLKLELFFKQHSCFLLR